MAEQKMDEKLVIKSNGAQVKTRTPAVVPNIDEPCQAIVNMQVVICEPMSDGTWRLVTSFKDDFNIILDHRTHDAARREVVDRLREIKQKWEDRGRIISLENLLTTGRPNLLKTEGKTTLPAQVAANL